MKNPNLTTESIDLLLSLGLNRLEAEAYLLLLRQPPTTGYQLAKQLGKQSANVYKALDLLATKGAIVVEEGNGRLCRAVPLEQFLQQLEQDFRRKTQKAAALLANLPPTPPDERIYQIESAALALTRAQQMLGKSQKIVILDAFPAVLSLLQAEVQTAVSRGVQVWVQSYAPIEIEGAVITQATEADMVQDVWQMEQLNLIIDGQECLLALFDPTLTKLHQATWSQNVYLSFLLHIGLLREHHTHQLLALPPDDQLHQQIQTILDINKINPDLVEGLKILFSRFGK